MKLQLLDLGRLECDEGFPLAGGGVSTASEPSPPVARLVFGHDADVLAELRREPFYD